jgi:hypothetical protein
MGRSRVGRGVVPEYRLRLEPTQLSLVRRRACGSVALELGIDEPRSGAGGAARRIETAVCADERVP